MRLSIKKAVFFSIAAFALGNFSCKETDLTCTAVIKVVRSIGGAAPSAKVTITSKFGEENDPERVDPALTAPQNTKITDSNGEVTYTFKYPAILDITASHISFGTAEDLIKLEEGETVRKTVTLQ
jgi:hypothetical protein